MTRTLAILCVRDEGAFLLEWLAHHQVVGFDDFLICTNDCSDGTDKMVQRLAAMGLAHHLPVTRKSDEPVQWTALKAADKHPLRLAADWIMVLDVDEFVNIHIGNHKLSGLLSALPEATAIPLTWRLFGNADRHDFVDQPVTQQFHQAAPAYAPRPLQAWAFKSLFRNADLFRRLGVHRPKGLKATVQSALSWVDGSGRPLSPAVWRQAWRMSKRHWGYDLVSLNHYAVRSAESFLVKRERGRINHREEDQGWEYWRVRNYASEPEASILDHLPRMRIVYDELIADPEIARLHREAVAWHRERISRLKSQSGYRELFEAITDPQQEDALFCRSKSADASD